MATVASKGQVTLPQKIRDALGIGPGSEVAFDLAEGGVILRKHVPAEAFDRWESYLRGQLPGASVDEMMDMLHGERLPDEEQGR